MGMKPHRRHHHHSQLSATDHGSGRQQCRQRFAEPHLIRQYSSASRQQPTGSTALMGKWTPTIPQRHRQISGRH